MFPNQKNKISDIIEMLHRSEIHAAENHKQAKEAKQQIEGALRSKIGEKKQQLQFMITMSCINERISDFILHNSYIIKRSTALVDAISMLNLDQPPSIDKRELRSLIEFSDCELKQLQSAAIGEMKASLKQTIDPGQFLYRVSGLWRLECRNQLESRLQDLAKQSDEETIWNTARDYALKHSWEDISKHLRNGDGGGGNEDKLIADILKKINKII